MSPNSRLIPRRIEYPLPAVLAAYEAAKTPAARATLPAPKTAREATLRLYPGRTLRMLRATARQVTDAAPAVEVLVEKPAPVEVIADEQPAVAVRPDRIAVPGFCNTQSSRQYSSAAPDDLPPPVACILRWPDPNVVRTHLIGDNAGVADLCLHHRQVGRQDYRVRKVTQDGRVSYYVDAKQRGWLRIGLINRRTLEYHHTAGALLDKDQPAVSLFSLWWENTLICRRVVGVTASCKASDRAERAERQTERKHRDDAEVQRKLQQSLAKAAEALRDEPVPTAEQSVLIHALIRRIAAMDPDRAKKPNGIGFGAHDSKHGHALAEMPELTGDAAIVARYLVRRYRAQLQADQVAQALAAA